MKFDQFSTSHDGGYDFEAIGRFWDETLRRLKVHAELAELEARPASPPATNERRAPGKRGLNRTFST